MKDIRDLQELKRMYNKYNSPIKFKEALNYVESVEKDLKNFNKRLDILEKNTTLEDKSEAYLKKTIIEMRREFDIIHNFLISQFSFYKKHLKNFKYDDGELIE